jgi:hypothetical protein
LTLKPDMAKPLPPTEAVRQATASVGYGAPKGIRK